MNRFIETHSGKVYDILVIGGGITGAAVAYEAASHGFSVVLVEKGDFGAATSSATSKLIHGGLRYLANFEFGLVRESLKERRTLENIAPNLVYPMPFLVPLYKTGPRKKSLVEPGLTLYDLLAYDKAFTWDPGKKLPWHYSLSREKVLAEEPIVNACQLTGGIVYYDCASLAPERLTLAFIRSAVKYGAEVANYAKVEDFVRQPGKVTGVIVRDLLAGKTITLSGKLIINCGGPWADLVLDVARGKPGGQHIRRSEGIHLITRKLNNRYAVGGMTPTGRACNIIPWRGHSLIGTTDREYIGDPDQYQVTRAKIQEYIDEVNQGFGNDHLIQYSDVQYAYGGLRPLIDDQTDSVYKTSRKYEIYDNAKDGLEGLLTVEGGKYTTSRNLAENVLKKVSKKLGAPPKKSITSRTHLAGCDILNLDAFLAQAKAANPGFSEKSMDTLARSYGTQVQEVLDIAKSDKQYAAPLNADGEMLAQVVFAVRSEMARTLTDILLRRTGIGTLGHPGAAVLEKVAEIAAQELNWDSARLDSELERAEKALAVPQ